MTRIGESILTEYVNEVSEKIQDDSFKLKVHQVFSSAFSLWRVGALAMNFFVFGFLFLVIVVLATMDTSTLAAVRESTDEQILAFIEVFLFICGVVAFFTLLSVLFFSSQRFFRDKRQERIEAEADRAALIRTIIEIQEELLFRHKLITREEIE